MADETIQRRTFLATIVGWVCSAFLLTLSVCGVKFLFDPLRSRKQSRKKQRIATLDSVPGDRPLRVVVQADRWDAYVHHPAGPIGTIWLTREESPDGELHIRCFQAACPHLGCGIDYAADRNAFFCPCHASEFAPDGSRRLGPSPRGMDELAVNFSEPDADGKRWIEIEYARFQTGIAQQRPV